MKQRRQPARPALRAHSPRPPETSTRLDAFLAQSPTVSSATVTHDGTVTAANASLRLLVGPLDSLYDVIAEGQGAVLETLLDEAGSQWHSASAGLVDQDGRVHDCRLSAIARGTQVVVAAELLQEPADRLNEHLLALNDELVAARRQLADGNRKLRELDGIKNMFIASATHDLKTPITSIVGYAEMLGQEELDDALRPMVTAIDRNAKRLVAMIDDLLGAALVMTGELRLERTAADVAELLRDAVAMIEPVAAAGGLTVHLDSPGTAPAFVDKRRLLQILDNLLSNAVKYSPDGGVVDVSCRVDGDTLSIAVSDSGIGISEEERARLFTRFFRATSAHDRGIAGTGLGLSNARAFAEAHGGTIECTSELGSGSTFTVILPLGEVPA